MASNRNERQPGTTLVALDEAHHDFIIPRKHINDGGDLQFFLASTAYRDLNVWLLQLNRSMFPRKGEHNKQVSQEPKPVPECIQSIRKLLDALGALIDRAPSSTGPRRFGNVAFRDWSRLAESASHDLLRNHVAPYCPTQRTEESGMDMLDELRSYLLGSFGSAQRLDYGTGHELSFLAFLGCLWKLGAIFDERLIVLELIQPYLQLVRKLIMTYTLEPAGSHGVWGLDDHSFLPYIFGSAQLGPPIDPSTPGPVPTEGSLDEAPSPSVITQKAEVADYKDRNMYFSAIQFIYDVKRGPFWEHSPVLFDISGIKDGWGKINKGMLKMYAAEVLGKFPVVQHFPFGSMFRWEQDPAALQSASSLHAQQQPMSMRSRDVPVPAAGGTVAPWAQPNAGPQLQSSTGVPSTRAPWAR